MTPGGRYTRKHKHKSVDAFLTHHMPIKTAEKGTHGEVFTPISIIDEMLAQLPQSVWSNPNLKWLDPACGIGNFPLKAIQGGSGYPGLFQGLTKEFPNPQQRLKHICSMITCYDINQKNIATLKKAFQQFYNNTPTVHAADFLASSTTDTYDIIMGNPPYNSGGTKRVGEKRLHVRFAQEAIVRLNLNGYLLFVCPPNYRQATSTMNTLFQQSPGYFKYIHTIGPDETHKLFRVQTRVDIFLWHNAPKKHTVIVDEYGIKTTVNLDLTRHIPNFGHSIFEKLRKQPKANIHAVRSAEASTVSCKNFSKSGDYPTLHLIIEEGMRVIHRKTPHSLQTTPKIFLNGLGIPYVFYDKDGQYGPTQVPVVITNPSKSLVAFMNSKLFQVIVWGLRLTGNNNLSYVFDDVPAGFGKGIEWTKEEQEFIESFAVPSYSNKIIQTRCNTTRKH